MGWNALREVIRLAGGAERIEDADEASGGQVLPVTPVESEAAGLGRRAEKQQAGQVAARKPKRS
jgi:hypothetical protein